MNDEEKTQSILYKKNEVDANKVMSFVCIGAAALLLILLILTILQFFDFTTQTTNFIYALVSTAIVLLLVPFFLTKTKFVNDHKFKYVVIALFLFVVGIINLILPKHGILAWGLIIILSNLYYDPKVTRIAFIGSILLMCIDIPLGMFFGEWDANLLGITETSFKAIGLDPNSVEDRIYWLNNYDSLDGSALNRWVSAFVYYFLPRAAILGLIYATCRALSVRTKNLLTTEAETVSKNEKISGDLSLAKTIQAGVLPTEFPESNLGSIYALMQPAREVGGDMYDFFGIDATHFAFCVADVSGKGVPAALFMMKTQSLIKALTMNAIHDKKGIHPSTILKRVNKGLIEGNDLDMFVTCWLGIFDMESGILTYTSAGHNPPIVKTKGEYSYLQDKPNLILGAMTGTKYEDHEIHLDPGDKIFIYTDGVTEAHNTKSELYGEDRLLNFIKNNEGKPIDTIKKVLDDIKCFADGAEQFDDITMLMFENRSEKSTEKNFPAKISELDNVLAYISKIAEPLNFSMKELNQLLICTEEIFVNIASYSYEEEGNMTLIADTNDNKIKLVFIDNGVKFDPLAKVDPDITMSADERNIGGLGIFMVKTMMDEVNYEYKNEHNILTIVKNIKEM